MHRSSRYPCLLSVLIGGVAFGQATQTAPAQDSSQAPATSAPAAPAPTPPPSAWTKEGIDFYLLGDVYGDLNFNHPDSGYNQLYNFNERANEVHLNMAKFSMERAPAPIGFRVDLGIGQTFDTISATDPGPDGMKYLEQVYVEFKPSQLHGIQLDFGKFVTSAGAEVIETNTNWNYSRSLLFALAIPYYHMGLRATIPVNKIFTTGVQVVNGWNDVDIADGNFGKTVGIIGNFAWKKVSWSNTYYTGRFKFGLLDSYRQVYDTVLLLNPNDKASVYLNFDYGSDKPNGLLRSNWTGFAAAARYQLTKRFAVSPRAEIFDDMDGFSTGNPQTVKEVTVTGEMKIKDYLLGRLEFRRDNSDHPYFDRGTGLEVAKAQTTMTLGLVAFFGPKK